MTLWRIRLYLLLMTVGEVAAWTILKRISKLHSIMTAKNLTCPRRSFLTFSSIALPLISSERSLAAPSPRTVDVGSGFDLYSPPPLSAPDVAYPPSLIGLWQCQRVVVQADGNVEQAETVWRALGGTGNFKQVESFLTKYIGSDNDSSMIVLDRGFEIQQRKGTDKVDWNVKDPNTLRYDDSGAIELTTVQRIVEPVTEQGWGMNELYRITTPAALGTSVVRAARVQRRFRRAYNKGGDRLVEGLEIVKTYRVLDGIAGTEIPTSTTKSQIRLTRPKA